jgi:hypothetical protein
LYIIKEIFLKIIIEELSGIEELVLSNENQELLFELKIYR